MRISLTYDAPTTDNEAGWGSSLAKLAALLEDRR
jgi:hypothetical protein